ncbi:PAS domain-containing protein [candidate division KSB1 bacterium]|nr:MAG: PAS domain-containing protein [candidate division KSB1 bacterium]
MRIVSETSQNFSTFLAARLIFVTVLLGVAFIFRPGGAGPYPYILLFALNAMLSLGCWEWFRFRRLAVRVKWIALTGAVVLDTLVLYYTGGANSEFVFLYFFSIGSAGLITGLPGGVWTAILSTAGIVWLYHSESARWFSEFGLKTFIYAINFLLTAFLTSYVYDRFQKRERTHQQTLGELEQLRLDTQAILDSLTTGIVVLDANHIVLYSNPAGRRILGLPPEADSKAVESVFGTETVMGQAVQGLLGNTTLDSRTEIDLVTSTGSRRPVGLSASVLLDASGERRGCIVLFSDLTRVKEMERAERERERLAAIGRLSRDLAHEIRNPLATVRGCVEMIQFNESESGEFRPYLNLALRESDRLNDLLRDFLTFARQEVPRKQRNDLLTLLRKRTAHVPEGLMIEDLLPSSFETEYDSDQLSLVIDAILISLFEWAESNGRIKLEPTATANRIRFLLEQKTISADVKDAAFQPLSGVQKTGSGLALPTALRVVHAHGGTLTLDSEPGYGTWFELTI